MAYVWKDGEPEDTTFVFDIKNWSEAHYGKDKPYVDIDVLIENRNILFKKSVSVDDYELIDLTKTFEKFCNGKMEHYYQWDHIEDDIAFCFSPEEDTVTIKVLFNPSWTHTSGFYFDLFSKEEYDPLFRYLKEMQQLQ